MNDVTPALIWREARKVTGTKGMDADAVAAAVLLASSIKGPDEKSIAEWLGIAIDEIEPLAINLRANGVWRKDGKVAGAEWFGKDGGIALLCDVGVAKGLLRRGRARKQPTSHKVKALRGAKP